MHGSGFPTDRLRRDELSSVDDDVFALADQRTKDDKTFKVKAMHGSEELVRKGSREVTSGGASGSLNNWNISHSIIFIRIWHNVTYSLSKMHYYTISTR